MTIQFQALTRQQQQQQQTYLAAAVAAAEVVGKCFHAVGSEAADEFCSQSSHSLHCRNWEPTRPRIIANTSLNFHSCIKTNLNFNKKNSNPSKRQNGLFQPKNGPKMPQNQAP